MSLQINGAPARERHSYLDPNIQITCHTGAVSIFTKPCSPFYSHSVFLIEGVKSDGKLFHHVYTLEGFLLGHTMSSNVVTKVSQAAGALWCALRSYGITKVVRVEYAKFEDFKSRVPLINAYSLWEISQESVSLLIQRLQDSSENPPPYSLTGTGEVNGRRAHNCFSFAQEELSKIGINVKNTGSYRMYVPLLRASGDTHIGKIESATKNYLGPPPHLKSEYERRERAVEESPDSGFA